MRTSKRLARFVVLLAAVALGACSSIGIGISLPIGGIGSVGVSVGSDGRVGGNVSVGTGGVSVGVGGTAELPRHKTEAKAEAPAAAPATPASAASAPNS